MRGFGIDDILRGTHRHGIKTNTSPYTRACSPIWNARSSEEISD